MTRARRRSSPPLHPSVGWGRRDLLMHSSGASCAEDDVTPSLQRHLIDPRPLVIAHRGCWRETAENSIEGICKCAQLGVDLVEVDLRVTEDGVVILLHDDTLERTTSLRAGSLRQVAVTPRVDQYENGSCDANADPSATFAKCASLDATTSNRCPSDTVPIGIVALRPSNHSSSRVSHHHLRSRFRLPPRLHRHPPFSAVANSEACATATASPNRSARSGKRRPPRRGPGSPAP